MKRINSLNQRKETYELSILKKRNVLTCYLKESKRRNLQYERNEM